MRKILQAKLVILFCALLSFNQMAMADGGTTCAAATVAIAGVNHSNHTGIVDQWFKYTATSDCIVVISSCGYTTSETSCSIISSCGNPYSVMDSKQCGTVAPFQSKLTYRVDNGQTILIRWNSNGAQASYDWSLTEQPFPAGWNSATAIPAVEGVNSTNHYGQMFDMYYSFIPSVDGVLKISNIPGMIAGQRLVLFIMDSDGDLNEVARSYDGTIETFVTKGGKYYICWIADSNADMHSWSLSLQPKMPDVGEACGLPIAASEGLNAASNVKGSQWFSYTPSVSGVLTISTCGLTTEDTYVQVYDACNSGYLESNDDNCGLQTEVVFNVVKDKKYLIKWLNNYTSGEYSWKISMRPYYTSTEFSSFTFNGVALSSVVNADNHSVNVVVGKNQDRSSLVATYSLKDNATATVGGDYQESGYTSNNFTAPVTYKVKAEDGVTTADWVITVTNAPELSGAKDILSYSFPSGVDSTVVDAANHSVKVYCFNSLSVTSLVANFTLSNYATASIGATAQVSGITANNFGTAKVYTVTAENGTTQDWTVEVVINAKPLGDLCSNPKIAVEGVNYPNIIYNTQYYIYTPTEAGYVSISREGQSSSLLSIYSDCSTFVNSRWLGSGDEFSFAVEAGVPVYLKWYELSGKPWRLTKHGVSSEKRLSYLSLDSYQIGDSPVDQINHTVNILVDRDANLASLSMNYTISIGAKLFIGANQYTGGSVDFTNPVTLTVKAQDGTIQNYLVTVTKRPVETGNDIVAFQFTAQLGQTVIDNVNHTVKVGVSVGTNRTTIIPSFALSSKATAKVGSVTQISGSSLVDFTNPVVYAVTSENAETQDWTVTVSEGVVKNVFANITSFRLNEQTQAATINAVDKTISVLVNKGTNRSALIPTFYLSAGAVAKVSSTDQVSGTTPNNFTAPVVYAVTSEDGLTTNNWTVTIKNPETDIVAYSIAGQKSSSIDAANKTIAVVMPYGSSVNGLVASFTISSGATIKVAAVNQVTGVTANDFVSPLVYVVTSEDGAFNENWTVTVSVAKNNEAAITAYSIAGQKSSTIDAVNKTIAVVMPAGSSLTNLVATYTISAGALAKVGSVNQSSGVTANNFVSAVVYVITAEDGVTTQTWTVNVSVASGIDNLPLCNMDVYPNPSNGLFHIKLNKMDNRSVQIDVFTVTGVKVFSKNTQEISEQVLDVDLTGNKPGAYYLRINVGGNTSTIKLMLN